MSSGVDSSFPFPTYLPAFSLFACGPDVLFEQEEEALRVRSAPQRGQASVEREMSLVTRTEETVPHGVSHLPSDVRRETFPAMLEERVSSAASATLAASPSSVIPSSPVGSHVSHVTARHGGHRPRSRVRHTPFVSSPLRATELASRVASVPQSPFPSQLGARVEQRQGGSVQDVAFQELMRLRDQRAAYNLAHFMTKGGVHHKGSRF